MMPQEQYSLHLLIKMKDNKITLLYFSHLIVMYLKEHFSVPNII